MHKWFALVLDILKSKIPACVPAYPVDRCTGLICDQRVRLTGTNTRDHYPQFIMWNPLSGSRPRQESGVPDQQYRASSTDHRRPVPEPLACRAVLQVDQATLAGKVIFRPFGKCRQDPAVDRLFGLCALCDHQETVAIRAQYLHNYVELELDSVRENPFLSPACEARIHKRIDWFA